MQTLNSKNLCIRLKSVENSFSEVQILGNFFPLCLKDKIYCALTLHLKFIPDNFEAFYFLKKNGLSFFFKPAYLYHTSFLSLCNNLVLPVIDSKLPKFSFSFRPFRNDNDIFLQINSVLKKNKCVSQILKITVPFALLNTTWLLKNFPFNKRLLNLILDKKYGNYIFTKNILFFSTIFNFLLHGLV